MITTLVGIFYLDDQMGRVQISGTIFEGLLLGRTYLPAGLMMWGFFTVLIVLATREVRDIFLAKGVLVDRLLITVGAAGGCALIYMIPYQLDGQVALAVAASGLVVLFMASLARHGRGGRVEGATLVASATVFGAIYLGLGPGFFLAIRQGHSPWVVAAVIAIVKLCDVGAYFVGRAVGRHKLCPWLSPGKTWEGLAGGVLMSAVTCAAIVALCNRYQQTGFWTDLTGQQGAFEPLQYPLWYAAIAGAMMGLVGQMGDLAVSFFKRDAGMKDSGQVVPGFGGFLDVFDSPMMVAPLAYWLLRLVVIIV